MTAPSAPWTEPCGDAEPDHTPTRFDLRQHEMWDLRGQGPGPVELWTAHDVPTQEYL